MPPLHDIYVDGPTAYSVYYTTLTSVLSVCLAWDCARHIASLNRGAQKITVGDKRQDSSGEHSASLTTVDRAGFALTGLTRPSALIFCVV